MSVEVKNISKQYGNRQILRSVSFSVQKNEILSLLGTNGSGKSTTLRIICGFLSPDGGAVYINGTSIEQNRKEYLKQIGYLPENNPLYPEMYVKEYLSFMAEMYQLNENAKSAVDDIAEKTGLTPVFTKKIGQLSKGFKQRVGLAGVLVHNPTTLILDEPGTGLDPEQMAEFREFLLSVSVDRHVIFSTHSFVDVVKLSNRVVILGSGCVSGDYSGFENLTEEELESLYYNL